MNTTYYHSPIGWIEIQASQDAITSLIFCDHPRLEKTDDNLEILSTCVSQLDEYFGGKRMNFDIPIRQEGTRFQQSVWNALLDIPFGKTVSYADMAKVLGNLQFVRAVGRANGQNKVWLMVPCHRVIGSDGSLTGYAGGIERKRWLLAHEANVLKSMGQKLEDIMYPVQLELF